MNDTTIDKSQINEDVEMVPKPNVQPQTKFGQTEVNSIVQ